MRVSINEDIEGPLKDFISSYSSSPRVMVVCGRRSYPGALLEPIFAASGIKVHSYLRDFTPNPSFEEIQEGVREVQKNSPDIIIGVGGGSVLDAAKILTCLSTGLFQEEIDLAEALQGATFRRSAKSKPRLVLMPTTAGSGAEATSFSVVYFGQEKYSFSNTELPAELVIANYKLVRSAPTAVLASSAMDAIAQSIESYWARASTAVSRKCALEGLKLMWSSAYNAVILRKPDDLKAIVVGSNLVGQAINISKTTANHALSYKITSEFGVPHGHCVGMLLPRFFLLHEHLAKTEPLVFEPALVRHREIAMALGYQDTDFFLAKYLQLLKSLGLENFEELRARFGFPAAEIASAVNVERLENHPVPLEMDSLESIFTR